MPPPMRPNGVTTSEGSIAPELLVVGNITEDVLAGGKRRLGGAAAYGARAALALGVHTAVVTSAPPESPHLKALVDAGLEVRCVPSTRITTFEIGVDVHPRRLHLRETAEDIRAHDIPEEWRSPRVAFVAPVAGECGREIVEAFANGLVVVGLQGWLRRARADGLVEAALQGEARDPPRNVRAAVLSVEDHPEAEALAGRLAESGITVALTRGARGSTLFLGRDRHEVPAVPASEVDATGAGDVFAVVFGIALGRGANPFEAAGMAARAAARSVEGPGLGRIADLGPRWLENAIRSA
jgi:sugar/nucleoside kinase (ribokinase family)